MYLRYAAYAIASLAVNLFVLATAWFWAIFPALLKTRTLGPLSFLHTHDDDVYGANYRVSKGMPGMPQSFTKRWKAATWWMMRNPAYGFDAFVLGIKASKVDSITSTGSVRDGGKFTIFWLVDGSRRFEYFRDISYSDSRYMKIRLGWKPVEVGGAYMLVVDFHPLKKR
jgi:hypothetical protein